jgi:cell wall-associated NlpC family hydrolase
MPVGQLLIDFPDLLPGDILLFSSLHQSETQKKISAATGSRYAHAAIYLGNNEIAEAAPPVQIRKLSDADKERQVIGVLRSQTVFSQKRAAALRSFAEKLIAQGVKYDFRGALTFEHRREVFVETLLQNLQENYGKIPSHGCSPS